MKPLTKEYLEQIKRDCAMVPGGGAVVYGRVALELVAEIERLKAQLAAAATKAMENAFTIQALRDKERDTERETMFRAADICRTYAHKEQNHSQTRRQVAYACERRIIEAASQIKVDALNERMENLSQESSDGQRSSPQPGARPS